MKADKLAEPEAAFNPQMKAWLRCVVDFEKVDWSWPMIAGVDPVAFYPLTDIPEVTEHIWKDVGFKLCIEPPTFLSEKEKV